MSQMAGGIRAFDIRDVLCCPKCRAGLQSGSDDCTCSRCGTAYSVANGIPRLFCPNEWEAVEEDVTEKIRAFYEQTPFPDYDEFDNVASFVEKARRGVFAKLLDEQIPFLSRVLECGCGTGQLTNSPSGLAAVCSGHWSVWGWSLRVLMKAVFLS